MSSCYQTPGQTILQHGESVATYFKDLIGERKLGWKLPDWFDPELINLCPDLETMELYHIYHDCGKPYCLTIDDEGRRHFPDHARISASIWRVNGGDPTIAELIARDMDMHLLKPAEADTYDRIDLAPALLLTALAELHANASMFGGIESTSFKIKWKALNKLGRKLINQLPQKHPEFSA
jgi:hypothetical protein